MSMALRRSLLARMAGGMVLGVAVSYAMLVEICQVRGSCECAPEDGNSLPADTGGTKPFARGYVRDALAAGWRVGFTAGGNDRIGHWGTEFRFG